MLVVVVLAVLGAVAAYSGVDLSQPCSSSAFSCMKDNGVSFAVVRVYQSYGVVDPNGVATINAAWAGGMSHVDGYIFPCFSCGNPAGQMDAAINHLSSAGLKSIPRMHGSNDTVEYKSEVLGTSYGMIWLDIEGTEYWSPNQQENVNFIQALADEGIHRGVSLGVYTSKSQWTPITGNSNILGNLPLWYAHYDNNPSYSDFVPFGGWSSPSIKQYQGDVSLCGCALDRNYY